MPSSPPEIQVDLSLFVSDDRQAKLSINAISLVLPLKILVGTVIVNGGWIITLLLYLFLSRQPASAADHATFV